MKLFGKSSKQNQEPVKKEPENRGVRPQTPNTQNSGSLSEEEIIRSAAIYYVTDDPRKPEGQMLFFDFLAELIPLAQLKPVISSFWKEANDAPEELKEKAFTASLVKTVLMVDKTFATLDADRLTEKAETVPQATLLKAWLVLDYYSSAIKAEYAVNVLRFRARIQAVLIRKRSEKVWSPVGFRGNEILIDSAAFLQWKSDNPQSPSFEVTGVMALRQKEPTISLYEDGVRICGYCLQTEGNEDFSGKYFHISVRLAMQGDPSVPVAQIDGFISDTPEDRQMTMNDIGYRMEGYFLVCSGYLGKLRYAMNRGQDLPMKALKYPGYTTPSNVRLIGICPNCRNSFAFRGYAVYMQQYDVAYSDDGLDCCVIPAYAIDRKTMTYTEDGKTFRYYNSFACPHCGTPYINYKEHPDIKIFGVSACVHLGRKYYTAK